LPALLLTACTSILPSTLMRLDGVSPTTADPAGFAVDLSLPTGLDAAPGSATLTFAISRRDSGQMASGHYSLWRRLRKSKIWARAPEARKAAT
jgi:hypothetical protein